HFALLHFMCIMRSSLVLLLLVVSTVHALHGTFNFRNSCPKDVQVVSNLNSPTAFSLAPGAEAEKSVEAKLLQDLVFTNGVNGLTKIGFRSDDILFSAYYIDVARGFDTPVQISLKRPNAKTLTCTNALCGENLLGIQQYRLRAAVMGALSPCYITFCP
ncbi:hypothetical protein PENTCL1PPCAC_20508, partial [Pristionchus entomophagus]